MTLSQELASNFSGVTGLFQSQVTTSSYTLQPLGTDFSSFNSTISLGITTDGSGNINGLTLNGAATTAFTFSGNKIFGAAGTPYSGLSFTYTGSGTGGTPIVVSGTQGVADQVYSTATSLRRSLDGYRAKSGDRSADAGHLFTSQYNTLVNQANDYTNFLLQQYAALTTQVETAGQQANVLNALFAAGTVRVRSCRRAPR